MQSGRMVEGFALAGASVIAAKAPRRSSSRDWGSTAPCLAAAITAPSTTGALQRRPCPGGHHPLSTAISLFGSPLRPIDQDGDAGLRTTPSRSLPLSPARLCEPRPSDCLLVIRQTEPHTHLRRPSGATMSAAPLRHVRASARTRHTTFALYRHPLQKSPLLPRASRRRTSPGSMSRSSGTPKNEARPRIAFIDGRLGRFGATRFDKHPSADARETQERVATGPAHQHRLLLTSDLPVP